MVTTTAVVRILSTGVVVPLRSTNAKLGHISGAGASGASTTTASMVRKTSLPVHWHSSHSSANREANGKDGMPTYEYACRKCGEHLEVVQSFRDEPLQECPVCGGELRKVFSPVGISFKGSGFYRNDSRSSTKAAKGEGHEKAPAASTSESSDSKSSDSKSDAKSSDGKSGDSKRGTGKKDAKPEAKTA